MQHILIQQSIFIRLYRLLMHGLLGLVLILPPLLGEEAKGAEPEIKTAGTQIEQQEQQQIAGDLNQRRKQNIARRERDQLA